MAFFNQLINYMRQPAKMYQLLVVFSLFALCGFSFAVLLSKPIPPVKYDASLLVYNTGLKSEPSAILVLDKMPADSSIDTIISAVFSYGEGLKHKELQLELNLVPESVDLGQPQYSVRFTSPEREVPTCSTPVKGKVILYSRDRQGTYRSFAGGM